MRACVQRVREASVEVDCATVGSIGAGLVVLLGVAAGDEDADAAWMAEKVVDLRIFADDQGYQDLGVFGSPNIKTPHVDRMAGEVARVRSELEQRVARRTFELEAANHKLRLLSERDMLTDLPNRALFNRRLEQAHCHRERFARLGLSVVPLGARFERLGQRETLECRGQRRIQRGERDLMDYFAVWADDKMLAAVSGTDIADMRIRDRIRIAVETRIAILNPHKEAVNLCFKKLLMPQNARLAASMTWRTADVIWMWAGDVSDDYNRYTKRGLLSGVLGTTMTYWLQDQSDNHYKTLEFLQRRIDNVLFVGKNASKIISPLARFADRFIVPHTPFNKHKV